MEDKTNQFVCVSSQSLCHSLDSMGNQLPLYARLFTLQVPVNVSMIYNAKLEQGKEPEDLQHKEKAYLNITIIDMAPSIPSALIGTHLPFNPSYRKECLVQKLKVSFPSWETNERRS